MLVIRLTRKGKKNQPFFRIIVIDKRKSAKGGRAIEVLGYMNPLTKKNALNKERVLHWLKVGVKPSPRIHNLLVSEGIISAKKINVFKKKKNDKTQTTLASSTVKAESQIPKEPIEKPAEAILPSETPLPNNDATKKSKPVEN